MSDIPSDLQVMGVVPGPTWEDKCSHGIGDYVATFEYQDSTGPPENRRWYSETLDMYVIEDGPLGQSLCLRFGNEPSDYYSGPLCVAWDVQHQPYRTAKAILLHLGQLRWMKR